MVAGQGEGAPSARHRERHETRELRLELVGGRSGAYEEELRKAREIALNELGAWATQLGADAVVGIDIDYETVGQGSMLMITASGTAVCLG